MCLNSSANAVSFADFLPYKRPMYCVFIVKAKGISSWQWRHIHFALYTRQSVRIKLYGDAA